MLPAELERGHRGIYLPFSSFLAAWMAGISWSMGQRGAGTIPRISPQSCSRGLNHGCAAALAPYSWAGGYSFCCFLCSLLPSVSPAAPPARSPAFFTLREGLAALGMQVIPGTFLLGRSHVLSRGGAWVTLLCTGALEAS